MAQAPSKPSDSKYLFVFASLMFSLAGRSRFAQLLNTSETALGACSWSALLYLLHVRLGAGLKLPRPLSFARAQILIVATLMLQGNLLGAVLTPVLLWFLKLPHKLHLPDSNFLKDQLNSDTVEQSTELHVQQDVVRRLRGHESRFLTTPPACSECTTVAEIWETSLERYANNQLVGHRALLPNGTLGGYEFESYAQAHKRMINFSTGICVQCPELRVSKSFNSFTQKQPKLGIYAKNCKEVVYSIYGGQLQSLCAVPLYDSIGEDAVSYIINHAELTVVCVSEENLETILHLIPGKCPTLKTVVVFKDHTVPNSSPLRADRGPRFHRGANILPFEFVEKMGEAPPDDWKPNPPPKPEDLSFILYTSGTTGTPKGVMLTHAGFTAVAGSLSYTVQVRESDVHLSYLPMAHAFENAVLIAGVMYGASVGFYHGNVKQLTEDAKTLAPTLFIGVPRVFQRVQQVILQQFAAKPAPIRRLIYHACEEQIKSLRATGTRIKIWDLLVFKQVKEALGGRVRIMCTGSAPLSPQVQEFIKMCFDVPMVEGYGLTECHGVCNAMLGGVVIPDINGSNPCFEVTVGHVGPPLASAEISLEDVPELGYTATSDPLGPCGEVKVRGPSVFKGYFKMPLETAETLKHGWLHTGDIGRINKNGTLSIIDRKKNIFKLSQGEYIAVEKLEQVYQAVPYVGQIFIYGNSFKPNLVAIVVPDPLELIPKLKSGTVMGFEPGTTGYKSIPTLSTDLDSWLPGFGDLCSPGSVSGTDVNRFLLAELNRAATQTRLHGYEKLRVIHVVGNLNALMQGFSVENGCLTPTFKLKRPAIQKRFQREIDDMYEELKGGSESP